MNEDQKEFEERSEYIVTEDLLSWNVENKHFSTIQNELKSTSIKLLVGPRGTGKTHQMKIFQQNCKENDEMPMCVYISFTKYFYLEPYLSKRNNAIQIFHSWVLAKVLLSCYDIDQDNNQLNKCFSSTGFSFKMEDLINFIALSERGLVQEEDSVVYKELSISSVIKVLESLMKSGNRKRCIVLLDDAALTLTQDYLVELFDIIRSLKSKNISPKASVYPGTTEYGPRFHVGHDADEVICWMNVEDASYSEFMDTLVDKRFFDSIKGVPKNIQEIFKYASFGIPRAFISLIRNYLKSHGTQQSRYNAAIEQQEEFIKSEYLSLSKRLPQFKKVIQVGNLFFDKSIELLTNVNINNTNSKQLVLGIEESIIDEHRLIPRMIQFLNEAGLLYDKGKVSHGVGRTYQRYTLHLLFLLRNRAFSGSSRGFKTENILKNIKIKSEKHPLRKTIYQILGEEIFEDLKLDFPLCSYCHFSRLSEEQLFCHNCGTELIKLSAFDLCLKAPVDETSLTNWQKEKMKTNGYKCIEDFVSKKDPASSLREIYQIGKVKAEKISENIEKFISEYLS